jgi:hypothetical protein
MIHARAAYIETAVSPDAMIEAVRAKNRLTTSRDCLARASQLFQVLSDGPPHLFAASLF